jgi:hypothetical protein
MPSAASRVSIWARWWKNSLRVGKRAVSLHATNGAADVFAYAEAEDVTLRIDGMETQVRRPRAGQPGRRAFVSGKRRQNTLKTTTISDHQGRTLWSGALRPGRMHDQTALHTEGIAEQFHQHPGVKAEVDDGYRGLANEFPDQVLPRRRNRRPRKTRPSGRSPSTTAGASTSAVSPPGGSASSTRMQKYAGGAHSSDTPAAAKPTGKPTRPSPPSSPAAPPSGPPGTRRVPNSCPSARRPAESLSS